MRGVCLPLILGELHFNDQCSEGVAQDIAVKSRNRIGRMVIVHDAAPVEGGSTMDTLERRCPSSVAGDNGLYTPDRCLANHSGEFARRRVS